MDAGWGNIPHHTVMDVPRFMAQEMEEVDNATYLLVLMVDAMVKIMLVSAISTTFHLHFIPSDLTGNLSF